MIRIESEGPVATLLLDRPQRRNALTPEMLAHLIELAGSLPETVRALILAGEGPVFCAGFDLKLCKESPDGAVMRALLSGLYGAISGLRDLPIPVVAAVQGAAVAGGCALLGGADFVVSHAEATFGYPVVALGISPAVSAPFLTMSVGGGAVRERLLDSGLISGREAARLGLVTECLANPADVRLRASSLAAMLAEKPPGAIRATRGWLRTIERAAGRLPEDNGLAVSAGLAGTLEERDRLAALFGRG